jgi:hypothetical protein
MTIKPHNLEEHCLEDEISQHFINDNNIDKYFDTMLDINKTITEKTNFWGTFTDPEEQKRIEIYRIYCTKISQNWRFVAVHIPALIYSLFALLMVITGVYDFHIISTVIYIARILNNMAIIYLYYMIKTITPTEKKSSIIYFCKY